MNAKTTIRKILFVTMWLCIGGGMLTLLLAAIHTKNRGVCKNYEINIKGAESNLFIDRNDIEQLLKKETNGLIKGQSVSSFRLHDLEEALEKNTWVSKAELYFDNNDVLHITVTEKEPVARVFTTGTSSFYIDSSGTRMPLSEKLSARVPVFTGFPDKKTLNARDSLLLNDVKQTANYIIRNPFWLAQVAQIDIAADRTFEMIPMVGDHVVRLGSGEQIDQKFHRLMLFYKQVLSKAGFDAYKVIDVQYEGQVVASKERTQAADTALLRRNVERLLQQSRNAQNDTTMRADPVEMGPSNIVVDSANLEPVTAEPTRNEGTTERPKPARNNNEQNNNNDQSRTPRAVMPRRTGTGH